MSLLGNEKNSFLGKIEKQNKYSTNEYVFGINSENDSHSIIVREIIKYKKKISILDVGCSYGIIGEAIKSYNEYTIDGVEIDKEAIKKAVEIGKYRNIFDFSIDEILERDLDLPKYNVIVFADILEHLVRPYDILKKITKYLKKDGIVLVSIPNIANIEIIKGLINNRFNYSNVGVMDTTHLRFFTNTSFAEMIDNVNEGIRKKYDVELIGTTKCLPENIDIHSKVFNIINNGDNKLVLQYIFKLKLCDSNEKSKSNHISGKNKKTDNYTNLINQVNSFLTTIEDNTNEITNLNDLNSKLIKELNEKQTIIEAKINEIEELKGQNDRLLNDNKRIVSEKNKINREKDKILKDYLAIINSRRWKFIDKLGNVKNKITKKVRK